MKDNILIGRGGGGRGVWVGAGVGEGGAATVNMFGLATWLIAFSTLIVA